MEGNYGLLSIFFSFLTRSSTQSSLLRGQKVNACYVIMLLRVIKRSALLSARISRAQPAVLTIIVGIKVIYDKRIQN